MERVPSALFFNCWSINTMSLATALCLFLQYLARYVSRFLRLGVKHSTVPNMNQDPVKPRLKMILNGPRFCSLKLNK